MQFKSLKKFTTSDWGKTAVIGILAGMISAGVEGVIWRILLDIASVFGLVALVVWIYRKIKKI